MYTGEYTWTHYGSYRTSFDAAFVRMLNKAQWIPDQDGNLQPPRLVLFGSLGWKLNPFLLSKIEFRPPIIDQLAREAGIEPGVLDLLKKLGVTSEAELKARLGIKEEPPSPEAEGRPEQTGDTTSPVPSPSGQRQQGSRDRDHSHTATQGPASVSGRGTLQDTEAREPADKQAHKIADRGTGKPQVRTPGGQFISYVGVHPNEEDGDPDGLDQAARMALEARAIDLILAQESQWQRTEPFNPGYDLFKTGPGGEPNCWCEVKAMTGSLETRPVGLSRTQFEYARKHRENYWLYVVEHAGNKVHRIVRIQDPAGKAHTFTFDHGWLNVAKLENPTK